MFFDSFSRFNAGPIQDGVNVNVANIQHSVAVRQLNVPKKMMILMKKMMAMPQLIPIIISIRMVIHLAVMV